MAFAGSIKADGGGNISGGEFDIDDGGGILNDTTPLAGQYNVSALPNGGFGGTITITNFAFPGSSIGVAFAYVLSADGTRGKLVELDGSDYRNAGTLLLQDSTALSSGNLAGTFAFGLDSDESTGSRTVEAGEFTLGASGVTGGLADESQAGAPTPRYTAAAIAASTAGQFTEPDASGRGTLTLNVNGDLTSYAYYVVNSGQFNLIQIDRGLKYGIPCRRGRPMRAKKYFGGGHHQRFADDRFGRRANCRAAVSVRDGCDHRCSHNRGAKFRREF